MPAPYTPLSLLVSFSAVAKYSSQVVGTSVMPASSNRVRLMYRLGMERLNGTARSTPS